MTNKFENSTTEELQAEIDRRNGVVWPKYATISVNLPWDDIDINDIAEQLEWDEYNDDIIQDKVDRLDISDLEIIISVDRKNKAEIVAVNGMKVSDEAFEIL